MAISIQQFSNPQRQQGGMQGMVNQQFNPVMQGMNAMGNLGSMISNAFGQVNALNSQNRQVNNALNVQSQGIQASMAPAYYQYMTALMQQEAANQRQTQAMGLLSQLIGSMGGMFGGGGGAGGGGFTTNYGAGVNYGPAAGGAGGAGGGGQQPAGSSSDGIMARLQAMRQGQGAARASLGRDGGALAMRNPAGIQPGLINGRPVGTLANGSQNELKSMYRNRPVPPRHLTVDV